MSTTEHWGRSPKFWLRADGIAALTRGWTPGELLEVGAGTGEMAGEFLRRGFRSSLYDLGEPTRAALRRRFAENPAVRIVDTIDSLPDAGVDYLVAFEVIEHIDDDAAALGAWTAKLRPGGRLLVSVPAHQRKFSATDHRVGHVRRYERDQLRALITAAGYEEVRIACYGFPLGNLGRVVGNALERRIKAPAEGDAVARSIESGTQQSGAVVAVSRVLKPWMLWPFFLLQRMTFGLDIGDGYIASARRSG
ncbi:MAG: class I SAM-dependent methyltransferase [Rhodanobacteraceae bacterium]|nr:class I SAM-dependent methyltransferase [Rhodanobacteraceae bacterium]